MSDCQVCRELLLGWDIHVSFAKHIMLRVAEALYRSGVIVVALQAWQVVIKDVRERVEDRVLPVGLHTQGAEGRWHAHRAVVNQNSTRNASCALQVVKALKLWHSSSFLHSNTAHPEQYAGNSTLLQVRCLHFVHTAC